MIAVFCHDKGEGILQMQKSSFTLSYLYIEEIQTTY